MKSIKNINKKLLIVVGILVLAIGVSFAYFTAKVIFNIDDVATTKGTTAKINGAILNVEGTLSFDDTDILPGHKNISSIKVTATGNNELIPYNLIWNGINSLNTSLNFTVYKTSEPVNTNSTCNKVKKIVNGTQQLSEECIISNIDLLGDKVSSGIISTDDTKVILAPDEFIYANNSINYYYVILEYPNLDKEQNTDIGGSFSGEVTVEGSSITPDINIVAVYTMQEDGTYKETSDIPEGYQINSSKSICSNGAKISGITPNIKISSLNKNNTSCYLYLDEIKSLKTLTKLKLTSKGKYNETDSFTDIATAEDTGIYETEDDYGTSYYFRGLEGALNNWVQFAGFYWRIIRINGNGSIRMIYSGLADGLPNSANKTGATTQIGTSKYNHTYNDNAYVGYMMGIALNGTGTEANTTTSNSTSYEDAHTNTYNSDIKNTIDTWYEVNINSKNSSSGKSYATYLDTEVGFCNDRQIDKTAYSSYKGDGYGTQATGYAPTGRLMQSSSWKTSQTPTLKCTNKERDLFTISSNKTGNKELTYPVGLITSDEVIYAGEFAGKSNLSYYLYTNENYWTISPSEYGGNNAYMFVVYNYGSMDSSYGMDHALGVRPVINLNANTSMTGAGSFTDPYVVTS